MVTVRFLNLLRSKYRVEQLNVKAGTLGNVLEQILQQVPAMKKNDFEHAVIFINDVQLVHVSDGNAEVNDGDTVLITHFVGGG